MTRLRLPRRASTQLIVVGVILVAVFFGATWAATASAPAWNTSQPTVVGIQGPMDHGTVISVRADGEARWSIARAGSYHDVTKLADGRVLVTFATGGNEHCGPYDSPCARTGLRILDPDPDAGTAPIAERWSYPVRTLGNSEVHDAEPLSNGRILVVGMDRERVFTVDPTASGGDVRPVWNASEHYDAPADPTRTDWLHMNDVDRLPDGRIMVSVRNRNQLVILENGSVDEVVNADGDPTVIRGQHNPQWLGDGAVLVADSSNDRIVELHRTANETWEPVWSVASANGIGFAWPRDADRLADGRTLVTDSRNNRLIMVDRNGSVLGIQRVPSLPYEADLGGTEPAVGPPIQGGTVPPGSEETDLGPIGILTIGLEHAYPLPHWVSEWHTLVTLVGLTFVLAGAWLRVQPVAWVVARLTGDNPEISTGDEHEAT